MRLPASALPLAAVAVAVAAIGMTVLAAPWHTPEARVPLIGFISPISRVPNGPNLVRSLSAYGYVLGQNFRIEAKFADRHDELLDSLADELVRDKPDVIVAMNPGGVIAARRATNAIPIVFAALSDPVGMGLAQTLARPGSNITGVTNMPADLNVKRLEILKDTLPGLQRVAIVARSGNANSQLHLQDEVTVARSLGLDAHIYNIDGPDMFEEACAAIEGVGVHAMELVQDSMFTTHEPRMMDAARRHHIAVIADSRDYPEGGGLLSYAADYGHHYETLLDPVAGYVDKILKGANPAELPVDQPMNVKLIVNVKTARALGIDLPRSLLVRANELIE